MRGMVKNLSLMEIAKAINMLIITGFSNVLSFNNGLFFHLYHVWPWLAKSD